MIQKKSFTSAFTLIELLVVITIIGILAGIALPVFNSVQTKGLQTKCLASAKQIGLALKLFAADNNGNYPAAGVPTAMAAVATSNEAFSVLFPTYISNETIFYNRLATTFTQAQPPDNQIDPAGTIPNILTLAPGENAYAYVEGLQDSDNSSYPLVADAFAVATNGTYALAGAGSTWKGTKTVVIHLDNSGSVDTLTAQGATYVDIGNTGTTAQANIFVQRAAAGNNAGWLTDTGFKIDNPATGAK